MAQSRPNDDIFAIVDKAVEIINLYLQYEKKLEQTNEADTQLEEKKNIQVPLGTSPASNTWSFTGALQYTYDNVWDLALNTKKITSQKIYELIKQEKDKQLLEILNTVKTKICELKNIDPKFFIDLICETLPDKASAAQKLKFRNEISHSSLAIHMAKNFLIFAISRLNEDHAYRKALDGKINSLKQTYKDLRSKQFLAYTQGNSQSWQRLDEQSEKTLKQLCNLLDFKALNKAMSLKLLKDYYQPPATIAQCGGNLLNPMVFQEPIVWYTLFFRHLTQDTFDHYLDDQIRKLTINAVTNDNQSTQTSQNGKNDNIGNVQNKDSTKNNINPPEVNGEGDTNMKDNNSSQKQQTSNDSIVGPSNFFPKTNPPSTPPNQTYSVQAHTVKPGV